MPEAATLTIDIREGAGGAAAPTPSGGTPTVIANAGRAQSYPGSNAAGGSPASYAGGSPVPVVSHQFLTMIVKLGQIYDLLYDWKAGAPGGNKNQPNQPPNPPGTPPASFDPTKTIGKTLGIAATVMTIGTSIFSAYQDNLTRIAQAEAEAFENRDALRKREAMLRNEEANRRYAGNMAGGSLAIAGGIAMLVPGGQGVGALLLAGAATAKATGEIAASGPGANASELERFRIQDQALRNRLRYLAQFNGGIAGDLAVQDMQKLRGDMTEARAMSPMYRALIEDQNRLDRAKRALEFLQNDREIEQRQRDLHKQENDLLAEIKKEMVQAKVGVQKIAEKLLKDDAGGTGIEELLKGLKIPLDRRWEKNEGVRALRDQEVNRPLLKGR